jgi:hypothetical protein
MVTKVRNEASFRTVEFIRMSFVLVHATGSIHRLPASRGVENPPRIDLLNDLAFNAQHVQQVDPQK